MNLLSRRSVLAIAAVVDVALHSRSAAKALAARHKLPPPPGAVAPGACPRQDPQGRARAAGRVRTGARAPADHGRRDRAHRDVAEHRRSGRSRCQLDPARAGDRSGRAQRGRDLSCQFRFDHRRADVRDGQRPRVADDREKVQAASLLSDRGISSLASCGGSKIRLTRRFPHRGHIIRSRSPESCSHSRGSRRANGNRSNLERDRAIARGVQAPDQDPDRAALRRQPAAMLFWAIGERLTAYWAA